MPDTASDPFDLQRFIDAQSDVYGEVLAELRSGEKRSHWMWFIFPQLRGLGRSSTAQHYGITGIDEARAYLAHPLLGARLRECVQILLGLRTTSADEVLGSIDALKLRSSLTLFDRASPQESLFKRAIGKYFTGEADRSTLQLLQGGRR